MKRNHIIGRRVTLTIHMVLLYMKMLFFFFGDFINAVFVRFVKQQNAEKTSVVFNFPVHWPSFFFSLSDGMKAQTKNLLHWSSEISLGKGKKE